MESTFIRKGLIALARAGMRSSPYLGHFGSAMLAGHFLCEELELPQETIDAIQSCFPLLSSGESADLFRKEEQKEEPNPELINKLREYLLRHVGLLSRSGHVSIIGMYALKGLEIENNVATSSYVQGIIRLLDSYRKERPQPRYYGYPLEYGTVEPKQTKQHKSTKSALTTSVSELHTLYANKEIEDVYYYFVGEKLHGFTHAHALYELENMGEKEIATRALPAHRLQMWLNRVKPPNIEPLHGTSILTPEDPEFWRLVSTFKHELGIPHALKRSYSLLRSRQVGISGLGKAAMKRFSYILQNW